MKQRPGMGYIMDRENTIVGIAYNAYDPVINRPNEELSEASVAEVAEVVLTALTEMGYSAVILPLRESLMTLLRRIKELRVDVLVNLCEGFLGRPRLEANVAAVFEAFGVPFTGSPSRALSICQDKFKAKAILNSFGLPTARGRLVTSADQKMDLPFPVIVKPNQEDASSGIHQDSVVRDAEALSKKIGKIINEYRQPALVEEYIQGREFNVAVLEDDRLEALPVSEIDFSGMPDNAQHICSYEAKWFEDDILYVTTPAVCPAPIEDSLRARLQQYALAAFQAMGCRDYARVDFRMAEDGRIAILEVNPNPDASLDAGYCRALKAVGIEYGQFWSLMVENALRRKEEPWFSSDDVPSEYPFFWHRILEQAARKKGRQWYDR
ncbi:MAG: ATP-grasp domain-containing protein [Acidobacteriota bacterium]